MSRNHNTYEKRRRELEKKRKAEDKKDRRRKKKEQATEPLARNQDSLSDSVHSSWTMA
jgi:hypothetical protein